jgi:hypothetical protein
MFNPEKFTPPPESQSEQEKKDEIARSLDGLTPEDAQKMREKMIERFEKEQIARSIKELVESLTLEQAQELYKIGLEKFKSERERDEMGR